MRVRFNGHNYDTHVMYWIKDLLKTPFLLPTVSILSVHNDECCDYWTPVDSQKATKAMILDDDFKLEKENI